MGPSSQAALPRDGSRHLVHGCPYRSVPLGVDKPPLASYPCAPTHNTNTSRLVRHAIQLECTVPHPTLQKNLPSSLRGRPPRPAASGEPIPQPDGRP